MCRWTFVPFTFFQFLYVSGSYFCIWFSKLLVKVQLQLFLSPFFTLFILDLISLLQQCERFIFNFEIWLKELWVWEKENKHTLFLISCRAWKRASTGSFCAYGRIDRQTVHQILTLAFTNSIYIFTVLYSFIPSRFYLISTVASSSYLAPTTPIFSAKWTMHAKNKCWNLRLPGDAHAHIIISCFVDFDSMRNFFTFIFYVFSWDIQETWKPHVLKVNRYPSM